MLLTLDFELSRVLSYDLLCLFSCDLGSASNKKKIFDFAHFLLLLVTLNPELAQTNRCLAAFGALYLSNRLFGDKKQWPKLKNTFNAFRQEKVRKNEGIFATLHLFSLINTAQIPEGTKEGEKTLKRKRSFADIVLNRIQGIFKGGAKKEIELEIEGAGQGKLFETYRTLDYFKDCYVGFLRLSGDQYGLELSFPLKEVKKISIQIFNGRVD